MMDGGSNEQMDVLTRYSWPFEIFTKKYHNFGQCTISCITTGESLSKDGKSLVGNDN